MKKIKYWHLGIIISMVITGLYNLYVYQTSLSLASTNTIIQNIIISSLETFFILTLVFFLSSMILKKLTWKSDLFASLIIGTIFTIIHLILHSPYNPSSLYYDSIMIFLFRTLVTFISMFFGAMIIGRKK